jgi:hypothetical protein
MMELHEQSGIHWFESVWMLKRYLGNTNVVYRNVMTYAMGYFMLYKLNEDTFPLNDSPILIRPNTIMVALSPRLLLEIDRTRNNIPHDCCISNYIPQDKLEEFRRRTIGNTFREIIFDSPKLLEEWRSTEEFADRHALMSNVKSYNAVVAQHADSEIWRFNAHSDRGPDVSAPTLVGPCNVLLYANAPQEISAENVVRIDFKNEDGRPSTCVPVFTDFDFAQKFLTALGDSANGMTIHQVGSLNQLGSLLGDLQNGQTTHVHFNAMPPGTASPDPVPIGEVIERLNLARAHTECIRPNV